MVPPGAKGNVTYIAPAGEYSLIDKVLELEFGGVKKVHPRLSPECKWLPATNPCPATANPLPSGLALTGLHTRCELLPNPQLRGGANGACLPRLHLQRSRFHSACLLETCGWLTGHARAGIHHASDVAGALS